MCIDENALISLLTLILFGGIAGLKPWARLLSVEQAPHVTIPRAKKSLPLLISHSGIVSVDEPRKEMAVVLSILLSSLIPLSID